MNESTSLRSHLVGQLDLARVGLEVRLAAWVETIRDHGGLIFLHLRDYSGRLQAVADPTRLDPEGWAVVERLHAEYCVAVSGKLEAEGTQEAPAVGVAWAPAATLSSI